MTATTNGGPAGRSPDQAAPQPQQTQPQLSVLGQYVKDFSFENPNAPRSLAPEPDPAGDQHPDQCRSSSSSRATDFEVSLKLEGKAETAGTVLFAFDLIYAGIFRIQNVPQEHLQPLLMIECPRLLFPFAREMICDRGAQRRLCAAPARPDRFRRALPAAARRRAARAAGSPTTA